MTQTPKIHAKAAGYAVLCETRATAHIAPQFATTPAKFRQLLRDGIDEGELCAKCAAKIRKMLAGREVAR